VRPHSVTLTCSVQDAIKDHKRLVSKKPPVSQASRSIMITKNIQSDLSVYGCETWSLTLTDERRLRVFENRVLRGIFGPERDEVTGEWRKLHN
jgi:hypothetical protein